MIVYPYKGFNPQNYGASNRVGTFPVGSAFTWHGGMHLETTSDIMAIADGEMVAYRLASDYSREMIDGERAAYYSNCFVLIKHKHEFDGGSFNYFSLYNHLWPVKEMGEAFVSEIFQKCEYVVEKEDAAAGRFGIAGVNFLHGRTYNSVFVPWDAELKVLEKGQATMVEKEVKVPYAPQKGAYYLVELLSGNDWFMTDKRFYVAKDDVVVQGEGDYMMATVKPKSMLKDYAFRKDDTGTKGIYHYAKPGDVHSVQNIMGVIAKGQKIEVAGKPERRNWYKVLDKGDGKPGGYIPIASNEKRMVSCRFSETDTLVNASIPVKAGALIGKGGMYGYEMNAGYRACHFEIFAEKEVEAFLQHASEKLMDYLSVTDVAKFGAALSVPNILKGYPVEVIETRGAYSKVKVPLLKKLVPYEYLGVYSKNSNSYALQGETDQSYVARKASTKIVDANTLDDLPQVNLAGLKLLFGDFLRADHRLVFSKKEGDEREVVFAHEMAGHEMWLRTHKIEEPLDAIEPLGIRSAQVHSSNTERTAQPSFIISVDEQPF